MIRKAIIGALVIIGLGYAMASRDHLSDYKKKRDFTQSPEPQGEKVKRKKTSDNCFVIQKHNASHLHYDFRLEIDGVLKSWAVPKGPSTDPRDKRLAVQTEDHPLSYSTFEGIIPEGHYGAGSVIVWDTGTCENSKEKEGDFVSLEDAYNNGHIEVFLHGKKLQGKYALIRTHDDSGKKWLLLKMRDEYADGRRNPVVTQPESVLSGMTIEELETSHTAGKKKLKK